MIKQALLAAGIGIALWCAYAYAQHDNGQAASSAIAKTGDIQGQNRGNFGVEIPAGVMFGKFEKENGPFLITGSIIVPSGQTWSSVRAVRFISEEIIPPSRYSVN